ncbi:hypothetical protein EAI_14140, partial [Harpegnathos saltator]
DCEKPDCLLKHGITVTVEVRFKPEKMIKNLINDVSAILFNVPLLFVGVDGTDAHDYYNADGSKAEWLLQGGVEYIYKNNFPVLATYPRVSSQ